MQAQANYNYVKYLWERVRRRTRLVIALDVQDGERALDIARDTSDLCDALKVNYPLILSAGLQVVDRLASHGDVLCDFKVADIPEINRVILEEVFLHSASGVIVHGFPGEDSLRACIDAAEGDIFVVALMSHPGAERFMLPVAEEMAAMAKEAGAAGIVAGATRPEMVTRLRDIVGNLLILSPGVGPQGGDASEALRAGADYLIVGRRITTASEPRRAAEDLLDEIRRAEESL